MIRIRLVFIYVFVVVQKKKDGHVNGSTAVPSRLLDPYADDDEDELRNIAKKFEEKYVSLRHVIITTLTKHNYVISEPNLNYCCIYLL